MAFQTRDMALKAGFFCRLSSKGGRTFANPTINVHVTEWLLINKIFSITLASLLGLMAKIKV